MAVFCALLLAASLLGVGRCDVNCRGVDGQAGVTGGPGRNGWPGPKGEKGEPAAQVAGPASSGALQRLKGEAGSRGPPGAMGPKGYRGSLGATGRSGEPGAPGPDGLNIGQGQLTSQEVPHSAFSAIRTENSYPPYGQVVTFQTTEVNERGDFNTGTGYFTCRVAGVYYFTFHAMTKVSICLQIASEALANKLGFCDYNSNRNYDQVLSGGVVLQLEAGQRVWLESARDQQTDRDVRDTRTKQIIFNGFLLFTA